MELSDLRTMSFVPHAHAHPSLLSSQFLCTAAIVDHVYLPRAYDIGRVQSQNALSILYLGIAAVEDWCGVEFIERLLCMRTEIIKNGRLDSKSGVISWFFQSFKLPEK